MKLDNNLIGILIGASLLLTFDLTAQAAGMSMGCIDPPVRSSQRNKAFRDRMFVRSDRHGLGQVPTKGSGFDHRPSNAYPGPRRAAPEFRRASAIPAEPTVNRTHTPQPDWVQRLYAKYPRQPDIKAPDAGEWRFETYSPAYASEPGR